MIIAGLGARWSYIEDEVIVLALRGNEVQLMIKSKIRIRSVDPSCSTAWSTSTLATRDHQVWSESLIHYRVGIDDQCLIIITNPQVPTPVGLISLNRFPPLSSSLHYVDARRSTPQHSAGRYWGGSAHSPDPTAQSAPCGRSPCARGPHSHPISRVQVWTLGGPKTPLGPPETGRYPVSAF